MKANFYEKRVKFPPQFFLPVHPFTPVSPGVFTTKFCVYEVSKRAIRLAKEWDKRCTCTSVCFTFRESWREGKLAGESQTYKSDTHHLPFHLEGRGIFEIRQSEVMKSWPWTSIHFSCPAPWLPRQRRYSCPAPSQLQNIFHTKKTYNLYFEDLDAFSDALL